MARIRLGKRERQLRKDQWAAYKAVRSAVVAENLATLKDMPTSKGYRLCPDLKLGYQFHDPSNLPRMSSRNNDQRPGAIGTKR